MRTKTMIGVVMAAAVAHAQSDSLRMDSVLHALPEVMVTGERPVVRADGGRLVFDLPALLKGRAADNAYDALKELPGVTAHDGQLLLGGRPVSIIIDGKVTTMTPAQTAQLLRSLPVGRLHNAEVMYAAPARYGVRGQLINLTTLHPQTAHRVLQGEVQLSAIRQHEGRFREQGSLYWQQGAWTVDALYALAHGHSFMLMDDAALHSQLDGTTRRLDTRQRTHTTGPTHDYRLAADWQPAEGHRLSLAYTGNYADKRNRLDIDGDVTAHSRLQGHNLMQNLRLDYHVPFGLKAGVDYTYYEAPTTQQLASTLPTGTLDYTTHNNQHINRWKVFADQEHQLHRSWGLNYGASYTTTLDRSRQTYEGARLPDDLDARQREHVAHLYVGTTKRWGRQFSLDVSLALERYVGASFREWTPLPSFTVQYAPGDQHLVQLSLSSDRTFPPYWAVQNAVGYAMGGYGEIVGNPQLRPSKQYQLQGLWMLHQKYQVVAWFMHTDDYFVQTNYQLQERLAMQYRYVNFDLQQQAGLMLYAPLTLGRWLRSSASFYGIWQREKDTDFYDLPFDRHALSLMVSLRNTLTLGQHLSAEANVFWRTRTIQGIFDLPASGNLSLALVWKPAHWTLRLYGNDLLETNAITPRMDFRTQHFRMQTSSYRTLGFSVVYNFGGYRQKPHTAVDVSRFKQ